MDTDKADWNRYWRQSLLVMAWLIGVAFGVATLMEAHRPGGQGMACACGVAVTPVGAVSKCTCRPCRCKR